LAGDTLQGSVLVDLGQGDRDPSTVNSIYVDSSTGAGKVAKDVAFSGGSGREFFVMFSDPSWYGTMEVGGDVTATSVPVNGPLEDWLQLWGTTVHGNVNTTRITYTYLNGATIDGNVNAQTIDSPCGMGLSVLATSTIHGNLTATGGATVPGCFSSARIRGTVDGNVRLNLTDGDVRVSTSGTIGGNFRISAAETVITRVGMTGTIDGSAFLDLGGSPDTSSVVDLRGSIGGDLNVTSNSGSFSMNVGVPATIGGNLNVHLGDGQNYLAFYGSAGSSLGGILNYHGGRGADTIEINGQNDFRMVVHTGGGDDTVAFAPDARVGAALIDFGTEPGTKTFIPPDLVDFALQLLNYP
jgi:cytoskeletal protein CcmA (bactofilin family)